MKFVIYRIRCKTTGKIYVGKHQTHDVNDGYMGSGKMLLRAIKKYGVENFEKTILHVFDDEASMNAKEAEIVNEEFCAREDTYNLCPGGKGGWGYVNQNGLVDRSSAGRKGGFASNGGTIGGSSVRDKKLGIFNPNFKEKLRKICQVNGKASAGRQHSCETKKKMSVAQKGFKNSQFGTRWITDGKTNKKYRGEVAPHGWKFGRSPLSSTHHAPIV